MTTSQQYRLARLSSGAKGTKLAMSRVRVDWYSLTLLPVGVGLVVSMSFLTWWKATLLVLGAFVGRNCLHAGFYALSNLYRREFSKSENARGLANSIQDLEGAWWIDPLTATSTLGMMFLVFPLFGLPYQAFTTMGRMFVMIEALRRMMMSPAVRAQTRLSFWMSVSVYLSPVALERWYR